MLASQQPPLLQPPSAQHRWPSPPQAVQVPPLHTSLALEQELPAQHGWFSPPQVAQVPPAHTSPCGQLPLAQHGWLAPPQAVQVPPESQIEPALHEPPMQHGCPLPPQVTHWLFWQARPLPQASLSQQGCPLPPQALQVFVPVHTLPTAH